jgi:hypothetical protein
MALATPIFSEGFGTCIGANVIDLLRVSLIVTQLFRSHGTFFVAESGQAWRPSVLYAQNIGVTSRDLLKAKNIGQSLRPSALVKKF